MAIARRSQQPLLEQVDQGVDGHRQEGRDADPGEDPAREPHQVGDRGDRPEHGHDVQDRARGGALGDHPGCFLGPARESWGRRARAQAVTASSGDGGVPGSGTAPAAPATDRPASSGPRAGRRGRASRPPGRTRAGRSPGPASGPSGDPGGSGRAGPCPATWRASRPSPAPGRRAAHGPRCRRRARRRRRRWRGARRSRRRPSAAGSPCGPAAGRRCSRCRGRGPRRARRPPRRPRRPPRPRPRARRRDDRSPRHRRAPCAGREAGGRSAGEHHHRRIVAGSAPTAPARRAAPDPRRGPRRRGHPGSCDAGPRPRRAAAAAAADRRRRLRGRAPAAPPRGGRPARALHEPPAGRDLGAHRARDRGRGRRRARPGLAGGGAGGCRTPPITWSTRCRGGRTAARPTATAPPRSVPRRAPRACAASSTWAASGRGPTCRGTRRAGRRWAPRWPARGSHRRAARVDRDRLRKHLLRDGPGAGRSAAGDGHRALGWDPHPADRGRGRGECLLLAPDLDLPGSRVIEIGGPDRVSCGELMREYARQRGLRRVMIPVPALSPRLSSPSLGLVTPVRARVGRELVEGLRNETVVRDPSALTLFPIRPRGVRDAIARALVNEDREFAATRWSDALSSGPAARSFGGAAVGSRLVDSRVARVPVPPRQGRPARGRPPRVRSRRRRQTTRPSGESFRARKRSELRSVEARNAQSPETLSSEASNHETLRAESAERSLRPLQPDPVHDHVDVGPQGIRLDDARADHHGLQERAGEQVGEAVRIDVGPQLPSWAPRRRIATRRSRRGSRMLCSNSCARSGSDTLSNSTERRKRDSGPVTSSSRSSSRLAYRSSRAEPRELGRHGRAQIGDGGHHQLSPVGPPEVDRRLADARVIGDRRHRRALDADLCGHRPRRVEDAPIRAGIARPAALALGRRGLARHLLIDGSTPFHARDERIRQLAALCRKEPSPPIAALARHVRLTHHPATTASPRHRRSAAAHSTPPGNAPRTE